MNIQGIIQGTRPVPFTGDTPGIQNEFRPSFLHFICKEKRNRTLLWISLSGMILQFTIFKFLYPYPDFFSDSYSYIFAAAANLDVSIWPIGYSKFLGIFHQFTHSDTVLVGFQYFFLELSALYFFFTVLYFYSPRKNATNILFLFLFFNPLFLYLSNYVNSDPLFVSLSLLWFSQLLWIIYRVRWYHIIIQAILLFAVFTVRHNAMYYPVIAAIAYGLSRQRLWVKTTGTALGILLIIPFIIHSRNAAYKMTGTHQFSLFSGWQLANNALYMYGHIQVDSAKLPSSESIELDRLSRQFYNQVSPEFREALSPYVGNFFIRQPESPLKKYILSKYEMTDEYSVVVAWGKASAVFLTYGSYLIKNHPVAFARYYMLLNAKNYFLPPLEKLENYNLGMETVFPIAQYWFDYKSNVIIVTSKKSTGYIIVFLSDLFHDSKSLFHG